MPKINKGTKKKTTSSKAKNGLGSKVSKQTKSKKKTPAASKVAAKKKDRWQPPERKVVYPKPEVRICQASDGTQLYAADAEKFLGWQIVDEGSDVPPEYPIFKDFQGNRVVLWNNNRNRPLRLPKAKKILPQEILRRNFKLNMENLIISRTGLVNNAAHRLIAIVIAKQMWEMDKDLYAEWWTEEPYIESTIALGASDDDDVVNTYDTGSQRTFADVLYRSPYFMDLSESARKQVSRICDGAVRTLWHRTGAGTDAFSLARTHLEMLNFLDRHERVLECVRNLHEWEGGKKNKNISKFLSLGYSSGIYYLMTCSTTYKADYISNTRSEEFLNFEMWDMASDFWHQLASDIAWTKPLKDYIAEQLAEHGGMHWKDRICMIINAWQTFTKGEKITEEAIRVDYMEDPETGRRIVGEHPTCSGIDEGEPGALRAVDPTPEEIAERSRKLRQDAGLKKALGNKKPKSKSNTKEAEGDDDGPKVEDKVWVGGSTPESIWRGTLTKIYEGSSGALLASVKPDAGYAGAGNEQETYYDNLYIKQADAIAAAEA